MTITPLENLYKLFLECGQKVCTDTRKAEKDAVFFALKGENFNANGFAQEAIRQGCKYAVVNETQYADNTRIFLVEDVLNSLQQLAHHHRKQFNIPVLAITGSNGKTTNKELIHAVLSKKYKTLATIGNLNNHIGVPLTLLRLKKDHEFAIIEMGANHQKEIEGLCKIADPTYGLITNIGRAHLEGFGGIEGVKKGKGELYQFLREKKGITFVNGDDEVLNTMASQNDKFTYGCKKLYDVIGKDLSNTETVELKYTGRYSEKDWNKIEGIKTQIVGRYNFVNCLTAAAIGVYFKVNDADIRSALASYTPNMNRSQVVQTKNNKILLDAYNANPDSMKAAIENFANYPAENKIVLLGDMFELGEDSAPEHNRLIHLLKEQGLKNAILVGERFCDTEDNFYKKFRTTTECKSYLEQHPVSGATILIKGSRSMKMEILQEVL